MRISIKSFLTRKQIYNPQRTHCCMSMFPSHRHFIIDCFAGKKHELLLMVRLRLKFGNHLDLWGHFTLHQIWLLVSRTTCNIVSRKNCVSVSPSQTDRYLQQCQCRGCSVQRNYKNVGKIIWWMHNTFNFCGIPSVKHGTVCFQKQSFLVLTLFLVATM
jgi:hypothetical protein